jgi:lysophospholipase L1-like esterase
MKEGMVQASVSGRLTLSILCLFISLPLLSQTGIGRSLTDQWSESPAPNTYRALLPASPAVEDPDGTALMSFYGSLLRTKFGEGVTRIIHYGDSHVSADIMTGILRNYFQRDFGDAGPGFIFAGKPYPYYSRGRVELRASSGWRTEGSRHADSGLDGFFGLAGLSFTAERPGERIWITANSSSFDLYFLYCPAAGSVEILLNGTLVATGLSLESSQVQAGYVKVGAGRLGRHTLEVRTAGDRPVRLYGVVAENGHAGVTYDAFGINGARAPRLLGWDWELLKNNLNRRRPALIIVSYGSNEVGDASLDLAVYRRQFTRVLNSLRRAAPNASVLVVAPPDRAVMTTDGRWRSMEPMEALVEVQRQAAFETGAAFFDLFRAMGGPGAVNAWASLDQPLAQRDRVHMTNAGYKVLADLLYAELIRAFNSYAATSQ